MKIGIIGLGSMGKRHARCLKQLEYDDVVALRTKKGTTNELPNDLKFIKESFNIDDFYSHKLDGVIISNPTSLHIKAIKVPLEKGIPIFVEKPLAQSLNQINGIENLNVSNIMVGYCFRYNKIINFVKEFINSGKLGRIYKANLYCGQFLPLWHPYTDYRTEYYSRKVLGGGALRTLSHEIDLIHYFFGKLKELIAIIEKISDLEIDVDDNVYIIGKTLSNVTTVIELDFLNPLTERRGAIFGSKGLLEYSFSKLNVALIDREGKEKIVYEISNMDCNDMYMKQMKAFVDFIRNKRNISCKYKDGFEVMKVIRATEDSMKTKSWQKIG